MKLCPGNNREPIHTWHQDFIAVKCQDCKATLTLYLNRIQNDPKDVLMMHIPQSIIYIVNQASTNRWMLAFRDHETIT